MTSAPPIIFPALPDQKDLGGRRRRLDSPYQYMWEHAGMIRRLTAPAGFHHDSASVPRIFWTLFDMHALDRAAIFHDLPYRHGGLLPVGVHEIATVNGWEDALTRPDGSRVAWTREEADRLFWRILREDPKGPGRLVRKLSYRAVSWRGKKSWRSPDSSLARTFEIPWERAA